MLDKKILTILCAAMIVPISQAENNSGLYVGSYTGYSQAQTDLIEYYTSGSRTYLTGDLAPESYLYGLILGYDWKINNKWVVGLALDYAGRDSHNTIEYQLNNGVIDTKFAFGSKIKSSYSIRARLGYILNKDYLVYLTTGVAKANIKFSVIDNLNSTTVSKNISSTGYVVGLGANYNLDDNFKLFSEYRYANYGSSHFSAPMRGVTYLYDQDVTENSILFGVTYSF